jgi:lysophospholipase L1-like esterase
LSVVTFGNSVAVMQMGGQPGEPRRTYSDVLADELTDLGLPATVALEAKWFDFLKDVADEWEERVRPHRPQVLIVQYGLNESQPYLAPVWLVRHLLRKDEHTTRLGRLYRRTLAQWLWKALRTFRRIAAPLAGTWLLQMSPHRFEQALRRLIHIAAAERGCLVLVFDVNPPGDVLTHFLPGQDKRHAVFQQVIRDTITSIASPQVRLFAASEICAPLPKHGLPDGMHFSPEAHELIGQALAGEIAEAFGYRREKSPRAPRSVRK